MTKKGKRYDKRILRDKNDMDVCNTPKPIARHQLQSLVGKRLEKKLEGKKIRRQDKLKGVESLYGAIALHTTLATSIVLI